VTLSLRGALAPVVTTNHAAITEPARIGELLRSIEGHNWQAVTWCVLRLAPLVFVRPGELRHAEWCEFELEGDEPRPASAGPNRGRVRHAHLTGKVRAAVEQLIESAQEFYRHYVKPPRTGDALIDAMAELARGRRPKLRGQRGLDGRKMTHAEIHGFLSALDLRKLSLENPPEEGRVRSRRHQNCHSVRGRWEVVVPEVVAEAEAAAEAAVVPEAAAVHSCPAAAVVD
jgi:integrase